MKYKLKQYLLNLFIKTKQFGYFRDIVVKLAERILKTRNGLITFYHSPTQKLAFSMIVDNLKSGLRDDEAINLLELVKATNKIKGDLAEVGVYKGGTAKLISLSREDKSKHLYLFDTYEGVPELGQFDTRLTDGSVWGKKGIFKGSLEEIQAIFANDSTVTLHKGYFPDDTGWVIKDRRFSLVHLDMDLYEGTLSALKFFYPRMSTGGIIISHDYNSLLGVKKAFDEFFSDKLETIMPVATTQCLVVILGSKK